MSLLLFLVAIVINIPTNTKGIVLWIANHLHVENLIEEGLINVSADSSYEGNSNINAPLEMEEGRIQWWGSGRDNILHYYEVDFKFFKPYVTSYSMNILTAHYVKKWDMIGSNDHINWEIIDYQELTSEPQETFNIFNCSNPGIYRYIRIQSNQTNFDNQSALTLQDYRFYGSLEWASPTKQIVNYFNSVFCITYVVSML